MMKPLCTMVCMDVQSIASRVTHLLMMLVKRMGITVHTSGLFLPLVLLVCLYVECKPTHVSEEYLMVYQAL